MRVRFLQPKPVDESFAKQPTTPPHARIISTAISLAFFLIPVRAMTVGFDWYAFAEPFEQLPGAIMTAVYDVFVLTLLAGASCAVLWRWHDRPRVVRGVCIGFPIMAVLMLLAGMINVEVVRMLGGPFNYRWLYYSDLFSTADGSHAMFASLRMGSVLLGTGMCAGMLVLAFALRKFWPLLSAYVAPRTQYAAALPLLGFYLFFSHWFLATQKWDANKLSNPVTAFLASLVTSYDAPALMTMRTSISPDDVKAAVDRPKDAPRTDTTVIRPTDAKVKNVLVFVMESVAAEYLETYGGKYPVTPTLNKYRDRSVIFKDVYAHAPATNMSLVSILCSAYPWVSYQTLTQEHPDVPLDSLSKHLKARSNYRTSFFASGDLVYQGAGKFLSHRSFDLVQDYHDRLQNAGQASFTSRWKFLNGTDDLATADSLIAWLNSGDANQPFFAMMWTLSTHYPYYFADKLIDFKTGEESQNRYLNALKHGDEALGRILAALEARGQLDSTLVVVVGDHGEAFGRHNQWGHGTQLYEENLKVPFVLINPKLFRGETRTVIGGLVDLAPTVLDVLGESKVPGSWQGRSLFDPARSNRVYFCAPWSDFLFGYRDGEKKLVYNATKNVFELFNLKNDPLETKNLAGAGEQSSFIKTGQEYMAAWVQYQNKFYDRAFRAPPETTAPQSEPPQAVLESGQ